MNTYFTDKVENQIEPKGALFQLLYNVTTSIDGHIENLESGTHGFTAGETYRTARSELGVLSQVFDKDSRESQFINEMYKKLGNLSHLA